MFARSALLVALSLAALQLALAGDLDYADPQTALWAIAFENRVILDMMKTETVQMVEDAAANATASSEAVVASQLAAWKAPIDAEMAKAIAAGVTQEDADLCKSIFSLDIVNTDAVNAVPLCVVVARAQYDARIKKIQAFADEELDLIIKTQSDIQTCANRPGQLLQHLCYENKLVWNVLTAQEKRRKAVSLNLDVYYRAAKDIVQDALDCTNKSIQRLTWTAEFNVNSTVECLEGDIADLQPKQ